MKKRADRARLVNVLRRDRHKQVILIAEELRMNISAVTFCLFALILLVMYLILRLHLFFGLAAAGVPNWFREAPLWLSLVAIFYGMKCQSEGGLSHRLLNDAQLPVEEFRVDSEGC